MTKCHVCFRHCDLKEGSIGFCGARIGLKGRFIKLWEDHIDRIRSYREKTASPFQSRVNDTVSWELWL